MVVRAMNMTTAISSANAPSTGADTLVKVWSLRGKLLFGYVCMLIRLIHEPAEWVDLLDIKSHINGWQLAKMKKSIPDMSLP